ncbi:RNA polymerase sigma-70 factor (ECF subfamily) [Nocardia sp. GAS34]|uniref:RNA polymerase subunit sigma-70 n=1 Tax=unclassified Nocardia TaxID=2637762 RepID=UPI003D21669F
MTTSAAARETGIDWTDIHARHRPELLGYSYRMLGSAIDAEEAVQETMLRAWRGRDGFAGRSSPRVWLYRIATNVCLDMLRRRPRRERPIDVADAGAATSSLGPADHARWLQPAPDDWLLPAAADPARTAVLHDSVRLAFVAALQSLSPMQRAVLILRDVLEFSAAETADLLDLTVAAANGHLRRARSRLAEGSTPPEPAELTERQRELLERFIDAFQRYDVAALTALLHHDATLSMPPHSLWLAGRDAVAHWFRRDPHPCRSAHIVRTRANGSPAFAIYHRVPDRSDLRAFAIAIPTVDDDSVISIEIHITPSLFPLFGLADAM